MNPTDVIRAAFATFLKFDRVSSLNHNVDADLRDHMCGLLLCTPEELDRALTPEVVRTINGQSNGPF